MKIALIGPGGTPIPPQGWGAVESLIWDYYCNLKKHHQVNIINESDPSQIISQSNQGGYDAVHIMYDDHIITSPHLTCKKIFYTSHFAYITHPDFQTQYAHYFNTIFLPVIQLQNYITINALSPAIKEVYTRFGFPEDKINVLNNGACENQFRFTEDPSYPDKTIYVAKIENRKKQHIYQDIPDIDFAGNYQDSPFNLSSTNYLGEWTKDTLYKELTNYANLLLLSDGEADPLVVKEALMAGLGVVVSECAAAHLNPNDPFIDIIPDNKVNDLEFVKNTLHNNRTQSIKHRAKIRELALEKFSWKNIVKKYLSIIS